MKTPHRLSLKIVDKRWSVYFCNETYFKRYYLDSDLGVTECNDRKIFLRAKCLKRETVIHELGHAYFWELCLSSCDPTVEQLEEIYCDMLANYGALLLSQAQQIMLKKTE